MLKDIAFPKITGVKVVVARVTEAPDESWQVFIINTNQSLLTNVMVVSKGYSEKGTDAQQRTSTLRWVIGDLAPNDYATIEAIDPSVFHLFNEYWVSFYIGSEIYDKRFVFVPDSITPANMRHISEIGYWGILHE
jgi:hypothetical protein